MSPLAAADAAAQALLRKVDERASLKRVHRKLQILARVLIVGTYIDDSIRITTDFSGQRDSMSTVGFPKRMCTILPLMFVMTQCAGVSLVLLGQSVNPQYGCLILGVWTAVHPFLYMQHHNLEFLLESLTLIGGLLILASSERITLDAKRGSTSSAAAEERTDIMQLIGRIFTSAVFVYYVVKMIHERIQSMLGNNEDEEMMTAVVEGVLLVLLLILTGLMVLGMRSRWCAGVLAIIMATAAIFKHPWLLTMWSKEMYTLDFVVGYEGTKVPGWLYSDHQRYFFFQQISTAGALLQLVVHGPGRYSMDEPQGPIEIVSMTTKGSD